MNTVLVIAAVIPALYLLLQVYRADRLEKEPISLLLGLLICGVIAAELSSLTELVGMSLLGGLFDVDSLAYRLIFFFGVVALSEEGFKYILLRARTWRSPHFNCSFDGVVYAVFLSLGFALWENIQYVLSYGLSVALARAVTAVPGHACFGVFMGTWYGLAKRAELSGERGRSRLGRWTALLMPMLLHGFYDFIAVTQLVRLQWLFVVFVLLLFWISYRLIRKMARDDVYL